MNRALFLFAFIVPLAPRPPESAPKIEIVGPSVLMNRVREGEVAIFDLRSGGRKVPGATKNLDARVGNAPVFALGDLETARKWAQKRALKSVFVVPPHLIEFETLRGAAQITPRAAWEKVRRDHWPLFDVSESIEFEDLRLPSSQRLDFSEFQCGDLKQLPKERPFIVACRVGHRSQIVTRQLRELGYDARNLNGGLWQWQVDGLPLQGHRR